MHIFRGLVVASVAVASLTVAISAIFSDGGASMIAPILTLSLLYFAFGMLVIAPISILPLSFKPGRASLFLIAGACGGLIPALLLVAAAGEELRSFALVLVFFVAAGLIYGLVFWLVGIRFAGSARSLAADAERWSHASVDFASWLRGLVGLMFCNAA